MISKTLVVSLRGCESGESVLLCADQISGVISRLWLSEIAGKGACESVPVVSIFSFSSSRGDWRVSNWLEDWHCLILTVGRSSSSSELVELATVS